MKRQEAYEIVTDKLLYFVAGGYTAQDTLREICHDSAFLLGDMHKEVEALKAKLQKVERERNELIKYIAYCGSCALFGEPTPDGMGVCKKNPSCWKTVSPDDYRTECFEWRGLEDTTCC